MSHQSAIYYYNTGLLYARDRNLDDAIEFLNRAISINPNHVNSYNVLGKVYIQKGEILAARECWQKALSIDPDDAVASQCLSAAKARRLQIQPYTLVLLAIIVILTAALITSILVLRLKSNDLQSKIAKSAAYTISTTMSTPASISKLNTKSQVTETYNNALAEYRTGKYDQAIRKFQQVLEYSPPHSLKDNAQYWLGECYYSKRKYDQALIEFQRVKTFFPKSDKVFYADLRSAYAYYKKNQIELARQKLLQLSKDQPDQEYQRLIESAKQEISIQKNSKY